MNESPALENENFSFTFSGYTKRDTKIHPSIDLNKLAIDQEEKPCRICLEAEENLEKFIRPCKCSGSVKYVHEECLKTWLVSLGKDIYQSKCEICSTKYKMTFTTKRKCMPRESCKTGSAHCFFIPILIAVMVMLFLIVYLLAQKYLSGKSSTEQKAYTIALTLTCIIAGLIIVGLIINSIKESCYTPKIQDWKIISQVFPDDVEVSLQNLNKFEAMRSQPLVIPKTLKFKGKKVRVPQLRPMLTPVSRRGRVVAFSPKYFTPVHSKLDKNSLEVESRVFKY